jgi:trigger factor
VALVDEEVPEVLVAQELQQRIESFANQLAANGISLERYLALTGESQEAVVARLRADAEMSVKVDLALRAVARGEGIEATDEDIARELEEIARQQRMDVAKVRARLEEQGSMRAVSSEVVKTKALEWLMEHVSLVDDESRPVDRTRYGLGGQSEPSRTDVVSEAAEPPSERGAEAIEEQAPATSGVEGGEA